MLTRQRLDSPRALEIRQLPQLREFDPINRLTGIGVYFLLHPPIEDGLSNVGVRRPSGRRRRARRAPDVPEIWARLAGWAQDPENDGAVHRPRSTGDGQPTLLCRQGSAPSTSVQRPLDTLPPQRSGHSVRATPINGILLSMTTHYVLTQAVIVAQEIEARGFLGTVGKIAAATIIFFIVIGCSSGSFSGSSSAGRLAGARGQACKRRSR
jgi:hypothetical protein